MLEHRGKIVSETFVMLVGVGSLYFLWQRLTSDYGQVGSYDVFAILTYFLLTGIFGDFLNKDITAQFEQYVRDGELVLLLQKPLSIAPYLFFGKLGIHVAATIISFFVSTVPLLLIEPLREQIVVNPETIMWAGIFKITSHLFLFSLYWVLGCLAFWLTNLDGIRNVTNNLFNILEGKWFPFDLAPVWFQNVMKVLPFQYVMYFPIQIMLGKTSSEEHITGLLVLAFSTILTAGVGYAVWRKGLYNFNAVGQ